MPADADPAGACAQAVALFFKTVGGWLRGPVRRGRGYVVTAGAALAALAIFGVRRWTTSSKL